MSIAREQRARFVAIEHGSGCPRCMSQDSAPSPSCPHTNTDVGTRAFANISASWTSQNRRTDLLIRSNPLQH